MFCKFCGENIDDNSIFCSKCGKKLNVEEKDDNINNGSNRENTKNNESIIKKATNKIHNIIQQAFSGDIIQKVLNGCIFSGIIGNAIFLIIVLVGLIFYGHVYLFHGYVFTKIVSIISIVLMIIGICGVITKCILYFIFKIGTFPTTIKKRVLLTVLTFTCLGCTIWGISDSSKDYWSSSGGWSYSSEGDSFYKIYNECNCASPWAKVGTDYLIIDTNPYDYDSSSPNSTTYASIALSAIRIINNKLSLPSYLYNEMVKTRAIDGRETYSGTKANVSWRYHPNSGLEVTYTK